MFIEFDIQTYNLDIPKKQITLTANMDIDADSVSAETVKFTKYGQDENLIVNYTVLDKRIILDLIDYPKESGKYRIWVDNVRNILNEKNNTLFDFAIDIGPYITNKINIIRPMQHESFIMNQAMIQFEDYDNTKIIKDPIEEAKIEYYYEISTDNKFYNIIHKGNLESKLSYMQELNENQYYLRIRAQTEKVIGQWSPITTFNIVDDTLNHNDEDIYDDNIDIEEDEMIIFEKEFEVIDSPGNNVNHEQFVIEFNELLDPNQVINFKVEKEEIIVMADTIDMIDLVPSEPVESIPLTPFEPSEPVPKYSYVIQDNKIIITPLNPVEDNMKYTISIDRVLTKEKYGEQEAIDNINVSFISKLSPLYVDVFAVNSLISAVGVSEDVILFNIKEASEFVNYLIDKDYIDEDVPFEARQYVKYRAARDSLLAYLAKCSTSISMSGTLKDISFEQTKSTNQDLKNLLDYLNDELRRWQDELLDFKQRGPAAPVKTIKASAYNYGPREKGYARGGFKYMAITKIHKHSNNHDNLFGFDKECYDKGIWNILGIFEYKVYLVRPVKEKKCVCVDITTGQADKRCPKCLGLGYQVKIREIYAHGQNYDTPSIGLTNNESSSGKIYYAKSKFKIKAGDIIVDKNNDIARVYRDPYIYISSDQDNIYSKCFTAPMKLEDKSFIKNFLKAINKQ